MDQQREEIALIQVVPLSYDVTIDVTCLEKNNASEEILFGQLLYKFEVKISTNTILLNGKELIIGKVRLLNEERKEVLKEGSNQIKLEFNNESNVTQFIFDSEINIGIYILEIEYSCKFRQDLMGCYGCNFNNKDGQSKRMCVTQFEAAWARAAFPCVDQPNAKAVFTVHIIHPPSLTALSNMPISSVDIGIGEDNKWTKTNFISSPKMSTYLVAWVVGEFEFVSGSCYDGKLPVRVYTLPGQSQFANFARDIAVETIEFLSNFTQIPIPLPKMDLIAIPDFQAGAMENWGLITFNETSLLADENISTTYQLQNIGSTISHELVHQWAGNLVTPFWWDDLWLNEGFATFLGNYVIDKLHPSWNRSLIYQSWDRNNAFSIDEIEEATHPIEVKVLRAVDADDIFDFIGEDRFKQGFTNYLMKHEYSNASSTDLWEALAESSENKELSDLMKSWTQQAGFPLIKKKKIKNQIIHNFNGLN
ncbi:MAG: putative Aminopeptidase M1-C [Streblomastix strix]|uniref:Putative Aminopeptidase M1-C n=1 Tax=Streblomastix strix TaxID=222440 RepID=A0A5J4UYF7_9EUKA|nr:MAG: putative Aminopeptidase M1-C [Streblomastix strix]